MAARSDPERCGARPPGCTDAPTGVDATVASVICDVLGYRTRTTDTQGFIAAGITIGTERDAPFLGTRLVLLSRQLEVISETVTETYLPLDSVFFGAAERQTVLRQLASQLNRAADLADAVFERLGLNIND